MKISEQTFDKASDSLFRFELSNLPEVISREQSRNLILNCSSVQIPGVAINVARNHWQGAYIQYAYGNVTFDAINIAFLIDEDLNNWKTLFNWVLFCNNNKDKHGIKFEENRVSGVLHYYNNYLNKVVLDFTFNYMWCTGVGGIELSAKTDGSQYLEAQANFLFDNVDLV